MHNGLIEWIYECRNCDIHSTGKAPFVSVILDEVFKESILLYWSPNNRYLAYIKTNLKNVSLSYFLRYDSTSKDNDLYSIPYPKYGDTLPIFDVYIYNLESGRTQRIPRPAEYERL